MFEIPGSDIVTVNIDEEVVLGKQPAVYSRLQESKHDTIMKDSQENEYDGTAQAVNNWYFSPWEGLVDPRLTRNFDQVLIDHMGNNYETIFFDFICHPLGQVGDVNWC